jgi:MYXO-CTERM domain-containing protein
MRAMEIRRVMMGMAAGATFWIAAPAAAQTAGDTTAMRTTTTETDDDDGPDLGWIGLLGLAGLAGLRRREPTVVHRDTVHTDPRR